MTRVTGPLLLFAACGLAMPLSAQHVAAGHVRDPGIGVISFAASPSPFVEREPPFADTLLILGLPLDALCATADPSGVDAGAGCGAGWVRVVHALTARGEPRTGWVRAVAGRTEIKAWAEHLPTRSLFFIGPEDAIAFHDGRPRVWYYTRGC